ncbi:MAG: hypothetical protein AAGA80_18215 [Cyanobacteria bacterium P01_F01_bin.143]
MWHSQYPKDQIQEVNTSLEKRLKQINTQINQLSHFLQQECQLERASIFKKNEVFPPQILEQVPQILDERLKPIEGQINELIYLLDQQLKPIKTKHNQISETPKILSITKKSFGDSYKRGIQRSEEEKTDELSNNLFLKEDSQGIFQAIKEQNSNNFLLFLNQERLTPHEFQNTFEFSIKHIDQVFDYSDEFNKNKHTGVKIINPAIAVNKQVEDSEVLELKVKGKLEFHNALELSIN